MIEVNEGDVIQGGRVAKRYISGLGGTETVVIEVPRHSKERRVINEMSKMGWTYHFIRDKVSMMWFREADDWNMEPGAGNS